MKRILAWIGILAIAIGFIALVYFTAIGASANVIIATLFCMLIIPLIIYAFLFSIKLIQGLNDSSKEQK